MDREIWTRVAEDLADEKTTLTKENKWLTVRLFVNKCQDDLSTFTRIGLLKCYYYFIYLCFIFWFGKPKLYSFFLSLFFLSFFLLKCYSCIVTTKSTRRCQDMLVKVMIRFGCVLASIRHHEYIQRVGRMLYAVQHIDANAGF